MLIGYVIDENNNLKKVILKLRKNLEVGIVWIDIFKPTNAEILWLKNFYDIDIPSSEQVDKIEVMTPFYRERNAYFMTSTLIDKVNNSIAITFILTQECLFTLRYDDSYSLKSFASLLQSTLIATTSISIFTCLIEVFINKIGDILDATGNELDNLIQNVLENPDEDKGRNKAKNYNNIIRNIGYTGNTISKNRESLASINRTLMYLSQIEGLQHVNKREYRSRIKHLEREISSMNEYASFLSQRNYFLLDGTLGMISVEQNIIIKIFTIASVVFMPPTLVASIYGMNFDYMPELETSWGYPIALGMMICSAILPYFFFKKRGWV